MAIANENNMVKSKHLESTAATIKRYIITSNAELYASIQTDLATLAAGNFLSTVPATVNGGMWLAEDSN